MPTANNNLSKCLFQLNRSLIFSALVAASFNSQAASNIDLQPIVVTSSSVEKNTVSNQSLIDREQLEASHAADIVAPLYATNSLNIAQGKASSLGSITLRGASGGQGLVTFDGVPLFANLAGFYSLRHFPTDVVDAIQIDRGFSQTLNQSRTLGGSIQLRSRQVRNSKTTVSAEYGSDQTLNSSVATGWGNQDNLSVVLGHTMVSDGDSQSSTHTANADNDNYRMNRALVRADKQLDRVHVDTSIYYLKVNEQSDGPGLTPASKVAWLDDPNGWFSDEVFIAQATTTLEVSDKWQSILQFGYTQDRQNGQVGTSPIGPLSMNLTSQLSLVDWQNHHQVRLNDGLNADIQWGGSSQHQRADTTKNNRHESHTLISPNVGLSLNSQDWAIHLSSRVDDNNEYGNHTLYSVGAEWQFAPSMALWSNYGRKFRAPGVNERLHPIYGNLALKAEHNSGGELGLRWRHDDSMHLSISAYQHTTHDLIVLALNPNTGASRANNIAEVDTRGVELSIDKQWTKHWKTTLNYTYMDAEDTLTGNIVAVRPTQRLNLTSLWQISKPLSLRLELNSHDGFWHDGNNTLWSGSVVKINTAITYQINDASEVTLRADNLTNNDTIELYGFDYADRAVYLSAKLSL